MGAPGGRIADRRAARISTYSGSSAQGFGQPGVGYLAFRAEIEHRVELFLHHSADRLAEVDHDRPVRARAHLMPEPFG